MKIDVPYFRQEKWYTCGPACLRMVLAFFGIIRTEEEITTECDTTELGTTPVQISTASYKFGLNASSVKNANIDYLKQELIKGKPVIVLVDPSHLYGGISGFGHFIVITGCSDEEIIYHDPDMQEGKYIHCSIEIFQNAWNASKCWMIEITKE